MQTNDEFEPMFVVAVFVAFHCGLGSNCSRMCMCICASRDGVIWRQKERYRIYM